MFKLVPYTFLSNTRNLKNVQPILYAHSSTQDSKTSKGSGTPRFKQTEPDTKWSEQAHCKKSPKDCAKRTDEIFDLVKNHQPPYQKHFTVNNNTPIIADCKPKPIALKSPATSGAVLCGSLAKASPLTCGTKKVETTCMKLVLKCCPKVRDSTVCKKHNEPVQCTRINPPVASFLECTKGPLPMLRKTECECHFKLPPCEEKDKTVKLANK